MSQGYAPVGRASSPAAAAAAAGGMLAGETAASGASDAAASAASAGGGCCGPCRPEGSLLRAGWEALIAATIAGTLLATTALLVFLEPEDAVESEQRSVGAKVLTALWALDVLINLRTSYTYRDEETGHLLHVRRGCRIAARYCRGWLAVDLAAVVPCIVVLAGGGEASALPTFFQAGGSRFIKALRLTDPGLREAAPLFVHRLVEKSCCRRGGYKNSSAYHARKLVSLIQFCTAILCLVHVAGCLWFWTGSEDTEVSGWVAQQGWDASVPTSTRWLRAFYWTMSTFTTVGYGDISASTNNEMIFTVVLMVVATLFNAWLIGIVTKSIRRRSQVQDEHEDHIARVREYMQSKAVPQKLQQEVLDFDELVFKAERDFNVHGFLAKLPPSLAFQMLEFLYIKKLREVECFATLPEQVIVALSRVVRPYPMRADDEIVRAGEIGREAFIISQGVEKQAARVKLQAFIQVEAGGAESDRWLPAPNRKDIVLTDGDLFGEEALDFDEGDVVRTITATALTDGELILIDADHVEKVAEESGSSLLKRSILEFRAARMEEMWQEEQPEGAGRLSGRLSGKVKRSMSIVNLQAGVNGRALRPCSSESPLGAIEDGEEAEEGAEGAIGIEQMHQRMLERLDAQEESVAGLRASVEKTNELLERVLQQGEAHAWALTSLNK